MLPILSPTDFVALLNQTLELAYPRVVIEGELANFRVSKNRWVYFDIKDEFSSVRFFGTVYTLPGPLTDGMLLKVTGSPKLHSVFGFSINIQSISLSGEGTIKKAFELLKQKLRSEGLFSEERKRQLPYPPTSVGLITSKESAAYSDFVKILSARWGGLKILHADVQVQGEAAARQIVEAIEWLNARAENVDVIVMIRGGGSMDDLQVFNSEMVTRAVAASRTPTIAAIGHERDITLVELAADLRASTPSNAAELLVPDRQHEREQVDSQTKEFANLVKQLLRREKEVINLASSRLNQAISEMVKLQRNQLLLNRSVIELLNPQNILRRGYTVIRQDNRVVPRAKKLDKTLKLKIEFIDGQVTAEVQ